MDPITQGAIGAAVALAVTVRPPVDKKIEKKEIRHIALAGWLGGMAPDLDVLIRSSSDPLLALEFHRHFTHSLIFIPLGGALVALLLMAFFYFKNGRQSPFWNRTLLLSSMAGWATHGLLDACTSYGTQLLWPFSNLRVAWNNVGIIDPIPTGLWLAATVLALINFRITRTRILTALGIVYLGLGFIQKDRAFDVQTQLILSRGLNAESVERRIVKPTVLQLFLWRSVYQMNGRYYADGIYVGPFGAHRIYEGESAPVLTHPALTSGSPQNTFERDLLRFSWFSDGWLSDMTPSDQKLSSAGDVRYAFLPQEIRPLWGIVFDPVKTDDHVIYETFREIRPGDTSCYFGMMAGLDCSLPSVSK